MSSVLLSSTKTASKSILIFFSSRKIFDIFSLSFLHGITTDGTKFVSLEVFFEVIHCILQNEKMSTKGTIAFRNSNK